LSVVGLYIFLSTLFLTTFNLFSSSFVTAKLSLPYNRTCGRNV
jgi:hypothetical protein